LQKKKKYFSSQTRFLTVFTKTTQANVFTLKKKKKGKTNYSVASFFISFLHCLECGSCKCKKKKHKQMQSNLFCKKKGVTQKSKWDQSNFVFF